MLYQMKTSSFITGALSTSDRVDMQRLLFLILVFVRLVKVEVLCFSTFEAGVLLDDGKRYTPVTFHDISR